MPVPAPGGNEPCWAVATCCTPSSQNTTVKEEITHNKTDKHNVHGMQHQPALLPLHLTNINTSCTLLKYFTPSQCSPSNNSGHPSLYFCMNLHAPDVHRHTAIAKHNNKLPKDWQCRSADPQHAKHGCLAVTKQTRSLTLASNALIGQWSGPWLCQLHGVESHNKEQTTQSRPCHVS